MSPKFLFLDFDGVLHPDEVYLYPGRGIVLKTANLPPEFEGHELFCYADALAAALEPFPRVRIVLSTSWVPSIGFSRTVKRLPEALRRRVIGSTFHSRYTVFWRRQTRYEQIIEHVCHKHLGADWLAIDNDDQGWPDGMRDHLVHTDDNLGIGDSQALKELIRRLK